MDSGKGKLIQAGPRIQIRESNVTQRSILVLSDLHIEDSGVYFCKFNNLWGPGTGLQVGSKLLGQHVLARLSDLQQHDAFLF